MAEIGPQVSPRCEPTNQFEGRDFDEPREEHETRQGTGVLALDPLSLRAWHAFLRAHVLVTRKLEADLLAAGDPPLAEYDVLVQLAVAPGRALRMHELADRIVLSRAGITRLVDRLVAEGLVERQKCGVDARGSYAVLTQRGLERVRAAAPRHLTSVKRHFLSSFDDAELERLAELLGRLASRARGI